MTESREQIAGDIRRSDNMLSIKLAEPVRYPIPGPDSLGTKIKTPKVVAHLIVIHTAQKGFRGEFSMFYFGFPRPQWWKGTNASVIYAGWGLSDDPFDLARGECRS